MSDAGLWGWKGRRAGCPLEALGVITTRCRPPDGAHTTERRGMERHHYKCEFYQQQILLQLLHLNMTKCTVTFFLFLREKV